MVEIITEEQVEKVLEESRERNEWEENVFKSWWIQYRHHYPDDNYPEEAPKEVRQAFNVGLLKMEERMSRMGSDKVWGLRMMIKGLEAKLRDTEKGLQAACMVMRNAGIGKDMPVEAEQCPACKSKEFDTYQKYGQSIGVEGGPMIGYTAVENRCHACGETGDFGAVNDEVVKECLEKSEEIRKWFDPPKIKEEGTADGFKIKGKRKEVTKEEFEKFIEEYPGKLYHGVFKAATPPVEYYRDYKTGNNVGSIFLFEKYKGTSYEEGGLRVENLYEIFEE